MLTGQIKDRQLRLRDGRMLGYRVYGDPAGVPLLFLHGTPGSRLKFSIGHEMGRRLELALVAPDRWGYGLSGVPECPSLAQFASDAAALMDHLRYKRFAVGGVSGGGPYAAAVAAELGSRIMALALISPVGPIINPRALAPLHRFTFTRLHTRPMAIAAIFRTFRWTLTHAPHVAARIATLRGGGSDRKVIARPDVSGRLLGSFLEGLRPGMAGPITDLSIFSRPWNIDLGAITAPSKLWIGSDDTAVPLSAAQTLASSIFHCTVEELPSQGHLWIAVHYPEVLEWVAGTVNARASVC